MIFSELLHTCELKRKINVLNTVKCYWAAYSKIKRRWPRKRLEWLVSVLPSLIFAMCKYCKHDVWYWIFYLFLANRLLRAQHASRTAYCIQVQLHTIAPSRTRTIPASWCQLCRDHGAEIDSVSRQLPACHQFIDRNISVVIILLHSFWASSSLSAKLLPDVSPQEGW